MKTLFSFVAMFSIVAVTGCSSFNAGWHCPSGGGCGCGGSHAQTSCSCGSTCSCGQGGGDCGCQGGGCSSCGMSECGSCNSCCNNGSDWGCWELDWLKGIHNHIHSCFNGLIHGEKYSCCDGGCGGQCGCGEAYYCDWISHPPYSDPCDCCGNYALNHDPRPCYQSSPRCGSVPMGHAQGEMVEGDDGDVVGKKTTNAKVR